MIKQYRWDSDNGKWNGTLFSDMALDWYLGLLVRKKPILW